MISHIYTRIINWILKMKKFILTVCILWIVFIWNTSFWYKNNCEWLKWTDLNEGIPNSFKAVFKDSLWKEMLTEEGFLRALRNLRKYCCFDAKAYDQEEMKKCKKIDFDDIKDDYPKTPYFLDHIINVMIRRLWPKSYEGLELDKKAAEREEEVKKYSTSTDWNIPSKLDAKFKEYWFNDKCRDTTTRDKLKIEIPKYLISYYDGTSDAEYTKIIENKEEWSTTINDSAKYKKIEEWDLTTKYLNICQTAVYINMKLGLFDDNDEDTYKAQKKCEKTVNDLIDKKVKLYSTHITIQTNLVMQNSLDNFKINLDNRNETLTKQILKQIISGDELWEW